MLAFIGRIAILLCLAGVPVYSAGFFGARVGSAPRPAAPLSNESPKKVSGGYAQEYQNEGAKQDRQTFGFARVAKPGKPAQDTERRHPQQATSARFTVNESRGKVSSTIYRSPGSSARNSATEKPDPLPNPRPADFKPRPAVPIVADKRTPVGIKDDASIPIVDPIVTENIDFTTTIRPLDSVNSASTRTEEIIDTYQPQSDSNIPADEPKAKQFSKPASSPPVRTRITKPILNSQPRETVNINTQQTSSQYQRNGPEVREQPSQRRPSFNFRGRHTPEQKTESRYAPEKTEHKNTNTHSARRPAHNQPGDNQPREFQYVPRGNVQIFSPSQNPTRDTEKPKLRELNVDTSRKPLAQDFLPSCPDAKYSYIIPSPTQCDLYYICDYGTPSKELCEDGMVFSIDEVRCVSPDIVDCKDRPLLQTPKGSGSCPRRNGVFFSDESCTEFITCRDDRPNYEKCAEGLVFDPKQKICAWADEALRPGCLPDDLLGFTCPNPKLSQEEANDKKIQLRFGDHDRFPDPDDCRYFFMCLITGQPRRAGCGNKKVFDPSTGVCRSAKDVPECADYYANDDDTSVSVSRATKRQRVQDDFSRQLQEERANLLKLRIKRWILEAEEADPE